MSISEEFVRLQELHERGTLTDAEFADAKAKVLAGEAPVSPVEIQRLQIQGEILRLDQDWAEERTRHMMYGRSGPACIPTIGKQCWPRIAHRSHYVVFHCSCLFGKAAKRYAI